MNSNDESLKVSFKRVEPNVWFVYVDNEYWGKLWQTLPEGIWRLVDKEEHKRRKVGLFLTPEKAKAEAVIIVSESRYLSKE